MFGEELVSVGEMELVCFSFYFHFDFPSSVRANVVLDDDVSSLCGKGVFVVAEKGARENSSKNNVCALNFRPVKGFCSKITS